MSFAFGHLIGAWILGKVYEKIHRQKLDHFAWFFLILGGILSDADFLIDWTFGTFIHRTFTHSFLFILVMGAVVYYGVKIGRTEHVKHAKIYALAIGAGIFMHLFLDYFSVLGVPLLWPWHTYFSTAGISFTAMPTPLTAGSLEELQNVVRFAVVDMALGTLWIFYLWWKKRITF